MSGEPPPEAGDPTSAGEVTRLLLELGAGQPEVMSELMPLVYRELRRRAHQQLRGERLGHTLDTSALVHETYLKLVDQDRVEWQNRTHFYAIASIVMRRVLVNYAKARQRLKRGGGVPALSLDAGLEVGAEDHPVEIIALDAALTRLAEVNDRARRVVECRFFAGLSIEETAQALDIAPMTVKRDWQLAKSWLRRELSGSS